MGEGCSQYFWISKNLSGLRKVLGIGEGIVGAQVELTTLAERDSNGNLGNFQKATITNIPTLTLGIT